MAAAHMGPLAQLPHHVRFHDQCVLIPDPVSPSRLPRIVRKAYSLPLWRRRAHSDVVHPHLKDEYPPLMARAATQSHSPTRAGADQPLVPCIVNSPTGFHTRHTRRASLSVAPRLDVPTVPLRPCCANCEHSTEQCLLDGDAWTEHFTRGALRLRNAGADMSARPLARHPLRHRLCDAMPGFDAIVAVDEVDRRRRSTHGEPAGPTGRCSDEELGAVGPDAQGCGSSSSSVPHRVSRARGAKSIAFAESEDELFPLPRSKTPSPAVSRQASTCGPSEPPRKEVEVDAEEEDEPAPPPVPPKTDVSEADLPLALELLYREAMSIESSADRGHHYWKGWARGGGGPSSALPSFRPAISHARHSSEDVFGTQRKRTLGQYLGSASLFRASADLLKGVNVMSTGGMPLAV